MANTFMKTVPSTTMSAFILMFTGLVSLSQAAFVTQSHIASTSPFVRPSSSVQPLHLFDHAMVSDVVASAANTNMWLATIDADIQAIPDNEFTTIFTGGIVVMFGGVFSALIVGFILENGNLYAKVAAESYIQDADDEEFWKGLSEEEKKKTQDVLQKLKKGKGGGGSTTETTAVAAAATTEEIDASTVTHAAKPADSTPSAKSTDMFSDYVD